MNKEIKIIPLVVGAYAVNCYLVFSESEKCGFLIDPGDEAKRIYQEVIKRGLTIRYIFNTHCHGDHIGAVQALCKSLKAEYGRSRKEDALLQEEYNINLLMSLGGEMPPKPDILLEHGKKVTISNTMHLKVIDTPGHTPGGICLLLNDTALFSGDSLFKGSVGRTDLPLSSHRDLISSLKKNILSLPGNITVYPGHEGTTSIEEEKKYNPFLQEG